MSSRSSGGFTLVELLVVMVIAGLLLAGFTAFYLSQQRALRHHQIEIEASQSLRTALEQITRDVRSARQDITRDYNAHPPSGGLAAAAFLAATSNSIEFQLDANEDGAVTTNDPSEHKGYRLNTSTSRIEQYDASGNSWIELTDDASTFALTFAYQGCPTVAGGALQTLTTPVTLTSDLAKIVRVDVTVQVTRATTAGLPITRSETESVRLRNVRCT